MAKCDHLAVSYFTLGDSIGLMFFLCQWVNVISKQEQRKGNIMTEKNDGLSSQNSETITDRPLN